MITAYSLICFLSISAIAKEDMQTKKHSVETNKENIRHVRSIKAVSNQGNCKNINGRWTCGKLDIKDDSSTEGPNLQHLDVDID